VENASGFQIDASSGRGSATVQACGFTLILTTGDLSQITCGSLIAHVVAGPIEILVSTELTVTVPSGATATVTDSGAGQFEIQNSPSSAGTIVVQHPDGTIELDPGESLNRVVIDVKPGGAPNSLNLTRRGVVAVAVLTTPAFDASAVDPSSVCFGDAEDESQRDCTEAHSRGHLEDVDLDLDLVLHYEVLETGIDPEDTEACLTGDSGAHTIAACDRVAPRPSSSGGP
jgi:hypothetical protein